MSKKQNIKTKKPVVRKPREKKELVKVENPESDYKNLPAIIRGDITPGQLILAGIKGKADVETMRGLFELAKEMKAIQARDEYYSALAIFQSKCPEIKKTTSGAQGKYKYATLATIIFQIKNLLKECGLSYHFETPKFSENKIAIACICHHKAGHSEKSEIEIPMNYDDYKNRDGKYFMTMPQITGTVIAYGRRYALCNILGISTAEEDDDGCSAPEPKQEKKIELSQVYKNKMIVLFNKVKRILNDPILINLETTKAMKKNIERLELIIQNECELTEDDETWINNIITKGQAKIDEHNKTAETKKKNMDELDTLADKGFEDLKNVTPKKSMSELFGVGENT